MHYHLLLDELSALLVFLTLIPYRRVTAIEFVIQIREDGEVIAMRL